MEDLDDDSGIYYETGHQHTINADGMGTSAIEIPATRKDFAKFKKKVRRIFKAVKICEKCPDRYKALTVGKECCLEIKDD